MNPARTGRLVAALLLVGLQGHADGLPQIDGIWLSGDGDGWIEISASETRLNGVIRCAAT